MTERYTPGPLSVTSRSGRQARIESDHVRAQGHWNDIYVEFSGFFGSYGAQMFAVAPEMLEVINAMLDDVGRASSLPSAVKARALLAKIDGDAS